MTIFGRNDFRIIVLWEFVSYIVMRTNLHALSITIYESPHRPRAGIQNLMTEGGRCAQPAVFRCRHRQESNLPHNTTTIKHTYLGCFQRAGRPAAFWRRPAFFGDAQWRRYNFYFAPNVTVRGNRRGNYACVSLFYSKAFVIVIRLVYKNLC